MSLWKAKSEEKTTEYRLHTESVYNRNGYKDEILEERDNYKPVSLPLSL